VNGFKVKHNEYITEVGFMTEWTADRRARRVPTFVIEATGLDTKKKIVANFGEGVTFHKGEPLPTPKTATEDKTGAPPAAETERQ